jgi:hypothetical protein
MYLGGLQSIAGQGENAAAQTGAFGTKAGEGIAQTQMAGGSAMAAGQMGAANAMYGNNSPFMQGAGLYGLYQNYNKPTQYGNPGG